MDQLTYFRQFHFLSDDDYRLLSGYFYERKYKKGEFIIQPGQTQKELLFVVEGVQLSYFEDENKLYVIAFTYPPDPCAIPGSFFFQQPSDYYLKCLSDSTFNAISFDDLQTVFDRSQAVERLFRKMTELILVGVIHRHHELHSLSIEERYRAFCKRSPHLLQVVPHKYIASYLGIDSTNFSKLFNSVRI